MVKCLDDWTWLHLLTITYWKSLHELHTYYEECNMLWWHTEHCHCSYHYISSISTIFVSIGQKHSPPQYVVWKGELNDRWLGVSFELYANRFITQEFKGHGKSPTRNSWTSVPQTLIISPLRISLLDALYICKNLLNFEHHEHCQASQHIHQ